MENGNNSPFCRIRAPERRISGYARICAGGFTAVALAASGFTFPAVAAETETARLTVVQDADEILESGEQSYTFSMEKGDAYGRLVIRVPENLDVSTLSLGEWLDVGDDEIGSFTVEGYEDGEEAPLYSEAVDLDEDGSGTDEAEDDVIDLSAYDDADTITVTPDEDYVSVDGLVLAGTADTSESDVTVRAEAQQPAEDEETGEEAWETGETAEITTVRDWVGTDGMTLTATPQTVGYLDSFTLALDGVKADSKDGVTNASVEISFTTAAYIDTITVPEFTGGEVSVYVDGTELDTSTSNVQSGNGSIYVNARASVIRLVVKGAGFTQTKAMEISARNTSSAGTEVTPGAEYTVTYKGMEHAASASAGTVVFEGKQTSGPDEDDNGSTDNNGTGGNTGDPGSSGDPGDTGDDADDTDDSGETGDDADDTTSPDGTDDETGSSTEETAKTLVDLTGLNLTATKLVSSKDKTVNAVIIRSSQVATEDLRTNVSGNAGSNTTIVYDYTGQAVSEEPGSTESAEENGSSFLTANADDGSSGEGTKEEGAEETLKKDEKKAVGKVALIPAAVIAAAALFIIAAVRRKKKKNNEANEAKKGDNSHE